MLKLKINARKDKCLQGNECRQFVGFRQTLLARLILLSVASGAGISSVSVASELNLNFIHGADKQHAPAILQEGTRMIIVQVPVTAGT
ncbi:hypothetical protein AAH559_005548 [Salmonella enterica]|nr:hypothetical protein [Salmonella enterica subsp. diarizonae serovar 17:z10:e,n,x,z15]